MHSPIHEPCGKERPYRYDQRDEVDLAGDQANTWGVDQQRRLQLPLHVH
jgi:hypothetical protein